MLLTLFFFLVCMKCLYQKNPDAQCLGEYRTQALIQFKANERSLVRKGIWTQFQNVVQEYMDLDHAELVPPAVLNKPVGKMFYLESKRVQLHYKAKCIL